MSKVERCLGGRENRIASVLKPCTIFPAKQYNSSSTQNNQLCFRITMSYYECSLKDDMHDYMHDYN